MSIAEHGDHDRAVLYVDAIDNIISDMFRFLYRGPANDMTDIDQLVIWNDVKKDEAGLEMVL